MLLHENKDVEQIIQPNFNDKAHVQIVNNLDNEEVKQSIINESSDQQRQNIKKREKKEEEKFE